MATSACNGMIIKVVNSNVRYGDGSQAAITITSAGPDSDGKGGTLTDAKGNSPPKVPITVGFNESYSFTASSASKSGGWARGTLVVQCTDAASPTDPGKPQNLSVDYSGQPSSLPSHASNCTGTGTAKVASQNFSASCSGSSGKGSGCVVTFTVMNGGSATQ